jgi:voltage-gated potassium channel
MKELFHLLYKPLVAMLLIMCLGTLFFSHTTDHQYSLVDCFYMTFITITTIGFEEVIDLNGKPWGRLFTILIAISGIGVSGYTISTFTVYMVEGRLGKIFYRERIAKMVNKLTNHFLVCGVGRVGFHIIEELRQTGRPFVVLEHNLERIEELKEKIPDLLFVHGDVLDKDVLLTSGILNAQGVFASTEDDNKNLIICLTARHLNKKLRIVSICNDLKNSEKMKTAGADAMIPTRYIGGLRMVSEMVRPTVVSFLDVMLRDKDKNLRVEEIPLSKKYQDKSIADLHLQQFEKTLLLAVKTPNDWIYNPSLKQRIGSNDVLIVMTTPEERHKLEHELI